MADNVTLNAGSGGAVLAADDISSVFYQRVKITFGADGAATDASSANPLPVAVDVAKAEDAAASSGDTGIAALTVRQDTIASSTSADGDYQHAKSDSVGRLYVNASGVAVPITDNSGSITVDNAGTFAVQAAQSGTWNVTNISGTVSLPTGAATAAKQPALGTAGSASTDVISIQGIAAMTAVQIADNGGSLTVDNGGTFAVQSAGTVAHDAAVSGGPVLGGAYASAAAPSDVSADGDAVRLWALRNGSQVVNLAAGGSLIGATSNALDVNIKSGAGSGGTAMADDAAFTPATTSFTPVGGIVTSDSVDSGDGGAFAMLANRQQKVTLYDSSGVELAVGGGTQYTEDAAAAANPVGNALIAVRDDARGGSLTSADGDNVALRGTNAGELYVKHVDALTVNSHAVTNAGTFVVQENGAALTSLQLIDNLVFTEDAAASSGDSGVQILTVRQDAIASSTSADGDYQSAKTNSVGALYTSLSHLGANALSTGNGTAGTGCQRVTIASDNTAFSVNATDTGAAAHDAAISGNPVRIAGRALTSDYTAVSAGDTADLITTLLGKLVTIPYANPANTWNYAAASGGITNTTGVTAKTAGGAGVRLYVTHVDVVNGHATVDTDVQIRDGASGTVLWRGFAKAAGGGVSAEFNPPLRGTANTLIEVANGTTGAATYFNLTGFSAAE